jgi:hypothetical protein
MRGDGTQREDPELEIVVAIVAEWLPVFAPPIGGNGFAKPYADRLKLVLRVAQTETLASVRRRVIEELKPVTTGPDEYVGTDPADAIHWCMFYEPEDADGIDDINRYDVAEDLIGVDENGLAQWNLGADAIRYGDLVRAGEHGLVRGDPRRPYVVLLYPQAGPALQTVWDVFLTGWSIFGELLTARESVGLGRAAVQRLRQRLTGVEVLTRRAEGWHARGAGPADIIKTVEFKPWPVDDLRILLGLDSLTETVAVLELLGLSAAGDGTYVISAKEEARVLAVVAHEAARASVAFADPDASAAQLRDAFSKLLDTWARGDAQDDTVVRRD